MTPAFELAPFAPSRRGDYLRLLGDAWGDGALRGEAFDWWFDGNPAGSLRSVALRNGEVVGVAGHSLCRFRVDGQERIGQFSVHAVTAPSARGLGIFRALEERHEEQGAEQGSVCVLGFASAPTRPLFLGPLGWSQIDRRRVWARLLPIGRRGTRADRFDERHATAYAAVAPRWRNHVVRSREYLDWRYARSPREYRIVEAPEGAFAVVGYTRRRGLRLGLLMELVAGEEEVGTLVRAALAEARGCAALLAVPSPCLTSARLARHGFVPTPHRLDFMGKGLAEQLDTRPEAWTVSLGDTDFF
ncbi:MAG: GNAT family N-acetyltransferase [Gaiellaceae bacterium]